MLGNIASLIYFHGPHSSPNNERFHLLTVNNDILDNPSYQGEQFQNSNCICSLKSLQKQISTFFEKIKYT